MIIPVNQNFRAENWKGLSPEERIEVLQNYENNLAAQEGRQACIVGYLEEQRRQLLNGEPALRGEYFNGVISIDPALIERDSPYQAVETYFHEARHAYQEHAVNNPEVHPDQKQVADWQVNEGGYIGGEDLKTKPPIYRAYYRWQPVEMDANNIARERTEELYSTQFQDIDQYPEFRARKEVELADDIEYAEEVLGENYVEQARQAVIENNAYVQAAEQAASIDTLAGDVTDSIDVEQKTIGSTEEQTSRDDAQEQEEESQDYYLGYSR